jgi:hypothetical protein
MTRTRYRIYEDGYPYFMTCTIVGWLAVFTRPEAVQIVFDSWNFLNREKQFRLYGSALSEIVLAHATSRTTRRHRLWIFRGIVAAAAPA